MHGIKISKMNKFILTTFLLAKKGKKTNIRESYLRNSWTVFKVVLPFKDAVVETVKKKEQSLSAKKKKKQPLKSSPCLVSLTLRLYSSYIRK